MVSMERGDVTQSSFGFICTRDDWQMVGNEIIRTVLKAELFDVSPVTFPAYPDATSGVRAALRSAPDAIRAKLHLRDSEDDDLDVGDDEDPVDNSEEGIWDDGTSEDYRCGYRCAACRSADLVHLSNLAEDDPAARSKKITRSLSNLSEDDLIQEQRRCSYRCAACRSLLSGHFPTPNAVNEDDETARAHAQLLSLRRR
jgi:hypothetical protein